MGQQQKKQHIDPIEQKALQDAIKGYYQNKQNGDVNEVINKGGVPTTQELPPMQPITPTPPPTHHYNIDPPKPQNVQMSGFQTPESFVKAMPNQQPTNVDPNLVVEFEVVPLPSKGLYYENKVGEVVVEKMTSVDEDILATPSLIENGSVLDVLIKRKLKTPGINTDELLVGDRNAILLFLRATSYGEEYDVSVSDPRTGVSFPDKVDLTKLKPKQISVVPDERGEFSFNLPKRNKMVKFKILNHREINQVLKTAEAKQIAFGTEFSEFGSMKLKAEVVEIEGNRSPEYIHKFIDALPAKDSATLKQMINDVTPDIDMNYEFKTKDGYAFKAKISVGVDFFFPFI